MPASENATLASRSDSAVGPNTETSAAAGSRYSVGSVVANTGAEPGSSAIADATSRLAASSYHKPRGSSRRS